MRYVFAVLVACALLAPGCGGSESPPSAGAPARGGGLSVQEALATDAEGPLLVRGHVVLRDGETRLCSALAESYPPQCGAPSLRVEGIDAAGLGALEQAGSTRWSEDEVALLGEVEEGLLTVGATSRPLR